MLRRTIAFLACSLAVCCLAQSTARAELAVGASAPDFTMQKMGGGNFTLSSMWQDPNRKIVVLDFWATWCGYCVQEIPYIKAMYADYKARGVEVVGVSLDDDAATAFTYAQNKGIAYTICWDANNDYWYKYGVSGLPTCYVIDRSGKIQMCEVGYSNMSGVRSKLDQLLAVPVPEPGAFAGLLGFGAVAGSALIRRIRRK